MFFSGAWVAGFCWFTAPHACGPSRTGMGCRDGLRRFGAAGFCWFVWANAGGYVPGAPCAGCVHFLTHECWAGSCSLPPCPSCAQPRAPRPCCPSGSSGGAPWLGACGWAGGACVRSPGRARALVGGRRVCAVGPGGARQRSSTRARSLGLRVQLPPRPVAEQRAKRAQNARFPCALVAKRAKSRFL